ncbi:inositol-3-phosphate synthase [Humibacillus xanthopallidus]|uniref:inositol-3-phosphate synthase n=1 Tax=Humibacillus xanthopallidus TaxID=412689 RepID=UPI0038505676
MSDARTGLWLVGARGSVATTVATGLALITARGHGTDGLVTEQPELAAAGLVALDHLVVGGHDVVDVPLLKRAAQLADAGVIPHTALSLVHDELERTDDRVRTGYRAGHEGQAEAVERLAADIRAFRDAESLARVVVINVSSTEAVVEAHTAHDSLEALEQAWAAGDSPLPPSAVYAAAAFTAGAAFIDFTPSTGARLPALEELAQRHGVPWGGSDGKTGETLVKSVLAPMFAARSLRVRSWAGTNLLGGGDGATLADPQAMESKARSKARGLEAMLGHPVDGPVHIDNIADLGDWKTAWDHLTFSGFLGTRMSMQFTWQGCDSSLAAPLVIDLARLADLALRRDEVGPLPALGFFFKDPVGSDEHRLFEQQRVLTEWATSS